MLDLFLAIMFIICWLILNYEYRIEINGNQFNKWQVINRYNSMFRQLEVYLVYLFELILGAIPILSTINV